MSIPSVQDTIDHLCSRISIIRVGTPADFKYLIFEHEMTALEYAHAGMLVAGIAGPVICHGYQKSHVLQDLSDIEVVKHQKEIIGKSKAERFEFMNDLHAAIGYFVDRLAALQEMVDGSNQAVESEELDKLRKAASLAKDRIEKLVEMVGEE